MTAEPEIPVLAGQTTIEDVIDDEPRCEECRRKARARKCRA